MIRVSNWIIQITIAIITWLIVGIIIALNVVSYVPIEEVNGVGVKYYHPDINKTQCEYILNQINPKWYKYTAMIHIYPEKSSIHFQANYHVETTLIKLANGCSNINDLKHELCHAYQNYNNDSWDKIYWHKQSFWECMKKW